MRKTYFITAFRNLRNNKLFSFINVLGLSIGISAALIIYLIVHYDLGFENFQKQGDRIYRIVSDFSFQGNTGNNRGVPGPLADAVSKELTGFDELAVFRYYNDPKLTIPGKDLTQPQTFKYQKSIIFADAHYFNLLNYTWLAGSPASSLDGPGKVVLSESRARAYFPAVPFSDLLGRKIIYNDSVTTTISGIVQDLNRQGSTDFTSQEFISLSTLLDNKWLKEQSCWDLWGSTTSDQQLYIRLRQGIKPAAMEAGLKTLFEKYLGAEAKKYNYTTTFRLQPLHELHFDPRYGMNDGELANKSTLYGLVLVASFLLLLGCINFINLTTAQGAQRAKEIGIRKTLGGSRKQLIMQFLSETFLITLFALCLSLLLTPLLLKVFSDFVPQDLHYSLQQPHLLIFMIILVISVSLMAGFYPALVLSSSQPVQILKNQAHAHSATTRKVWVRQTLTITQFVIAQAFIMGTLLVGQQIRFMLNKNLGFSKESILSYAKPVNDTSYARRLYLVSEMKKISGVTMASLANDLPNSGSTWSSRFIYKDGKKEVQTNVELKYGDTNYIHLFHIPLLAGRNLLAADTPREVIINETYLKTLGFDRPEQALGKSLIWDKKLLPIVGVMKDFHAHSLNYTIQPMVISEAGRNCSHIIVSMQPAVTGIAPASGLPAAKADWKTIIAQMKALYNKTYPGEEFNYEFFDESLASAYDSEQRISALLRWATGLTILISSLGLLGLVIYTTSLRTKEIGVRKVLGASVAQIVAILSKDFVKLVGIGFIIAVPIAWWAIHKWLENYAFRTSITWWTFVISGIAMAMVALITLSFQTIRAAMTNPAKSLRSE